MHKLNRVIIVPGLLCFAFAPASFSATTQKRNDIAWFQNTTQRLRNAIVTGDKSVWNQMLAQDFIMTTEDGEVLDKQQVLADLKPLRPGFSGVEKIRNLTVRQWSDTAVVHFWMDEREDAYGQVLKTTYVETDTFRWQTGKWQMISAQVTVVPRNLEPVKVSPRDWSALVGKYGLNGRASWPYCVFTRDGALYGGRDVKFATQLIPLSPLVYYQKGSIHIMVFIRDAGGAVNQVLELHKYNEVALLRISKERT